jgi:hypothetical protein
MYILLFAFHVIEYRTRTISFFFRYHVVPEDSSFLSRTLSGPNIGSPNLRAIFDFGPVYLAIFFLINNEMKLKLCSRDYREGFCNQITI